MERLTHQDCKELKDAGWPQRGADNYILPRGQVVTSFWQGEGQEDACADPTLLELIEACGDNFGKLESYLNRRIEREWRAVCNLELDELEYSSGVGTTPEQAVKNLWIALNKKHETEEEDEHVDICPTCDHSLMEHCFASCVHVSTGCHYQGCRCKYVRP